MRKTLTLEIPTSWADVSLEKYLELQNDLESYKDDEEAVTALMLYHLCGLDAAYLKSLSNDSYNAIKERLNQFLSPDGEELQQFITIDGVKYGFEPNLSNISYGAYADISQHDSIGIDKNWAKIMSILYRPVENESFGRYSIQPYTGEIKEEQFLKLGMDIHFGAWFFFIRLQTDLLKDTLNSLKEMELPHNIKSILAKSGEVIQQSLNLPMGILRK